MYKEAGLGSYDQTLEEMVMKISKLPLDSVNPARDGIWQIDRRSWPCHRDRLRYVIRQVPRERILQPLQMSDTGFYVKPEKIDRVAKPGQTRNGLHAIQQHHPICF